MAERWVSGSSLKRALICPASTVLERSRAPFSEASAKASEFGTLAHEYVEDGTIYVETQEWCSRFNRLHYYPDKGLHEVICWYDPETGDMGLKPTGEAKRKHRDYSDIPAHCFVGTIDYMCPLKDGRWWVDDLKTGNSFWLPKPSSDQMLFAATVICHVMDGEVITSITSIPRYPIGTKPDRKKYVVDRQRALAYLDKLDILYAQWRRQSQLLAMDMPLDYVGNRECKFCPSRTFCPIGKEVVREREERPNMSKDR